MLGNRKLWLIDAGYMFKARHSIKDGYEFNYLKLREKIEETGEIWRAYYLNSVHFPVSDQLESFHHHLRSAPPYGPKIIVKLYPLKKQRADKAFCETCNEKVNLFCPNNKNGNSHFLYNEIQKGVDVGLATLALIHQDKYDTLVLSSGDSDLLDAIEYLSELGKRIELVVFNHGVSTELQSRSNKIFWIDDFESQISER
jgi:uncharacterized LabA/DUF88 family protein